MQKGRGSLHELFLLRMLHPSGGQWVENQSSAGIHLFLDTFERFALVIQHYHHADSRVCISSTFLGSSVGGAGEAGVAEGKSLISFVWTRWGNIFYEAWAGHGSAVLPWKSERAGFPCAF
jgi:hypothetical protein